MTDLFPNEIQRIVVALLVGALIGLDRERSEVRKTHQLFAGVRTFPLIALTGAFPMLLFDITGPALLIISFVAVASIALMSYFRTSANGDVGATTEIAAFTTFLLGVLSGAGYLQLAGTAGVVVAILLVAKPRLEAFSRALTAEEISATLELAVISIIILPLLPDQEYGPWQSLNPFHTWLIVVLVCGLSFAGFIAVRLWGERRGLIIAGVIGALVSSTAVTVAMATRSRAAENLERVAASATVLASTIMCVRVAILAGVVDTTILPRLLPALGAMTVTSLVAAWLLGRSSSPVSEAGPDTKLTNPFSLREALWFGVIYTVIQLGAGAAQEYFGARGMYAVAIFSAAVEVDAITIALTRLGPGVDLWRAIVAAITLAVVTNTLVKLAIAMTTGAAGFRWKVALALSAMAFVGGLTGIGMFFSHF